MTRALILAAGGSRRFGSPKQLALIDGRPLLAHVLAIAAPHRPLTVLGAAADEILRAVDVGDHVIAEDWADGQSASLRAGLAALGPADRVLVLLGDMPYVTREVIAAVLAADGCARATYGGRPGHPVVLDRAVLDRVGDLRGDTGARDLLSGCVEIEASHLSDPTDIDTPDQL